MRAIPPLLLALAAALSGCSEKQDIVLEGTGALHVQPPERVVFAEGRLGADDPQLAVVELDNRGGGVLAVQAVRLEGADDGELVLLAEMPRFSAGPRAGQPRTDVLPEEVCPGLSGFVLAPQGEEGSTCYLFLLYEPVDGGSDRATLRVLSDDPVRPSWAVAVETLPGAPRISVEPPGEFVFEDVLPGQEVCRTLLVRNVGSVPLEVTAVELVDSGAGDFELTVAAGSPHRSLPAVLAPQEAEDILLFEVCYLPDRPGEDKGELRIRSSDPSRPQMLVSLQAVTHSRCVQVTPLDVDFGEVLIGEQARRTVEVNNCGTTDLRVLSVALLERSHQDFSVLAPLDGLSNDCTLEAGVACLGEARLEPGASQTVLLGYAPAAEGAAGGRLVLETDVPDDTQVELQLYGRGTHNRRPVAVCEARVLHTPDWDTYPDEEQALQTIPLTTIELQGSGSFDPDGPIHRHKWRIAEQPETSGARILPAEATPDPTFMPDVAGLYVLELEVMDEQGASSRPSCQVFLDVVASGDIHVELTWDTPADPDQSDAGFGAGADVDLHLLHPLGDWFCAPRDLYFANANPDWGNAFDPSDDPSLDRDDTDGWGPENVTLDSAEGQMVYRVGVHYFDDHGYGPSFATLKVFIGGVLRYEQASHRLGHSDDFWDVATIAWPSGLVTPIDRTYNPPPRGDCGR